jgi:hypothetical protein
MAASLKATKKMKLDYVIDREVYDQFVRACSHKGFSQNVVIEKLMKTYTETGRM